MISPCVNERFRLVCPKSGRAAAFLVIGGELDSQVMEWRELHLEKQSDKSSHWMTLEEFNERVRLD